MFSEVFTLCVYTDPVRIRKTGSIPRGIKVRRLGLEPRTNKILIIDNQQVKLAPTWTNTYTHPEC